MLKYRHLEHALTLAKLGSLRKAAAASNLSQPAFSRSISALEHALRVTLFDRSRAGVTPTDYGEVLLRRSAEIAAQFDDLQREIRLMKEGDVGELSLAMGPYPGEISGHRAVGRVLRGHAKVSFRVDVCDWREVATRVRDRRADLGLAELSGVTDGGPLVLEPVGRHKFVLFCRAGHPLSRRSRVTGGDLRSYPFVAIRLPKRLGDVLPVNAGPDPQTGDTLPSVVVEDIVSARYIVMESDGVSGAAPIQIERELRAGELTALAYWAPWMSLNYGFIYLRERRLSTVGLEYMRHVREIEEDVGERNEALLRELLPRACVPG